MLRNLAFVRLSKCLHETFLWKSSLLFESSFTVTITHLPQYSEVSRAMEEEKSFFIEYASQGRAKCKSCKEQIAKSVARIGKLVPNPFSDDGGTMKHWYHIPCMFDALSRARSTTKKIESTSDLEGFDGMKNEERNQVEKLIQDLSSKSISPTKRKVQAKLPFSTSKVSSSAASGSGSTGGDGSSGSKGTTGTADNSFKEYCKLCMKLAEEPSYNAKTEIISNFIKKGPTGGGFKGDVYILVKLLLPGTAKRVYNLQSKQILKLFSQIFGTDLDDMTEDLEQQGDVSVTVERFFKKSLSYKPAKKSTLTLEEVDKFLDGLTAFTKEDDQQRHLTSVVKKCTHIDLKFIIRLIKSDLRMNTGAKHVLEGLDPDAYQAFQASHNLKDVVKRCLEKSSNSGVPSMKRKLSIRSSLMTPVKPMLASPCKSVAEAIKKCKSGLYAEIKYDGERVQIHKSGDKFEFFSRSLKPVVAHKVADVKDFLPKACPHGDSLILDSEILLVDNKTGKPLPFGTLGVHKKSAQKAASVCLFIFDCLQFNDENLMEKPIKERRNYLSRNIKEIPNRIKLSEMQLMSTESSLQKLMMKAIKEGLEGLVLKDINSIYEPGKRHWLKMKKDYLSEGSMADTADLVVLGAYYGTGNKGGVMSVFLMGVLDKKKDVWCTVAKCGNGFDDKTIDKLNKQLKVKKIGKDLNKVPSWLNVDKTYLPDFIVEDPKKAPVWEVTGAEFSQSTKHTAAGISIRFPRFTRIRDDKDWKTATSLEHLVNLYKTSKEKSDVNVDVDDDDDDDDDGTDDIKVDEEEESVSESKNKPGPSTSGQTALNKGKRKSSVPLDIEEVSPKKKKKTTNLPSIFHGVKVFFKDNVTDEKELGRYVIAYDGDVLKEFEKSSATHIISTQSVSDVSSGEVVSPDWIRECIKKGALVSVKKFRL